MRAIPCSIDDASFVLDVCGHYLGPTKKAAFAIRSQHGVTVFANPRARNIPAHWKELVRWGLLGGRNTGSVMWSAVADALRLERPDLTTIVSYSDPSVGHTGALYRACNWLWAPTWQRLRPPPSGNGSWTDGKIQSVKDRWVYPLQPDPDRAAALRVTDDSITRRWPWAEYREPEWRRGRFDPSTGGGNYKRFVAGIQLREFG
jgi:hypothetical protein